MAILSFLKSIFSKSKPQNQPEKSTFLILSDKIEKLYNIYQKNNTKIQIHEQFKSNSSRVQININFYVYMNLPPIGCISHQIGKNNENKEEILISIYSKEKIHISYECPTNWEGNKFFNDLPPNLLDQIIKYLDLNIITHL